MINIKDYNKSIVTIDTRIECGDIFSYGNNFAFVIKVKNDFITFNRVLISEYLSNIYIQEPTQMTRKDFLENSIELKFTKLIHKD